MAYRDLSPCHRHQCQQAKPDQRAKNGRRAKHLKVRRCAGAQDMVKPATDRHETVVPGAMPMKVASTKLRSVMRVNAGTILTTQKGAAGINLSASR